MYTSPHRYGHEVASGRGDCARLMQITQDASRKKDEVVTMMRRQLEVADVATAQMDGLVRMLRTGSVSAEHLKTKVQQLEDEIALQKEAHKVTVSCLQQQSSNSVQLLTEQVVELSGKLTATEMNYKELYARHESMAQENKDLVHEAHEATLREQDCRSNLQVAEAEITTLQNEVDNLHMQLCAHLSNLLTALVKGQTIEYKCIVLAESQELQSILLEQKELELRIAKATLERKDALIDSLQRHSESHDLELSRLGVELNQRIYTLEEEVAAQQASRLQAETKCMQLEALCQVKEEEAAKELKQHEKIYMKQISDLEEALRAAEVANRAFEGRLEAEIKAREGAENEAVAATARLASAAQEWEAEKNKTRTTDLQGSCIEDILTCVSSPFSPVDRQGLLTFNVKRGEDGTIGITNQGVNIVDVDSSSAAYEAGVRAGQSIVAINGSQVETRDDINRAFDATVQEYEIVVIPASPRGASQDYC